MELLVIVLFVAPILGLIPAAIASRKGHSFIGWWFFGWILFIIALPVSFFIEDRSGKKCPSCAEWAKEQAIKCRFCGADLTAESGGVSFWPRTWIEFFIIALVLSVMVYFAVSIYRAG